MSGLSTASRRSRSNISSKSSTVERAVASGWISCILVSQEGHGFLDGMLRKDELKTMKHIKTWFKFQVKFHQPTSNSCYPCKKPIILRIFSARASVPPIRFPNCAPVKGVRIARWAWKTLLVVDNGWWPDHHPEKNSGGDLAVWSCFWGTCQIVQKFSNRSSGGLWGEQRHLTGSKGALLVKMRKNRLKTVV